MPAAQIREPFFDLVLRPSQTRDRFAADHELAELDFLDNCCRCPWADGGAWRAAATDMLAPLCAGKVFQPRQGLSGAGGLPRLEDHDGRCILLHHPAASVEEILRYRLLLPLGSLVKPCRHLLLDVPALCRLDAGLRVC